MTPYPPQGDGWIVVARYVPNLMRGFRHRRTDRDDEGTDAEFWEHGDDSVKARVVTGIVLTAALVGIAALVWLASSLA